MAVAAQFTNQPSNGALGLLSVANAGRDGTGTVVTIFTAGKMGSRIERVVAKALGTTTAGMIRFFIDNLTVKRLIHEELVSAITASATVAAWQSTIKNDPFPLILAPNNLLIACTEKGEQFAVTPVEAGDF